MKIRAEHKDGDTFIVLEEVFSGVLLRTRDGEQMGICMRDSGFEFQYEGQWYSAQQGEITLMGMRTETTALNSDPK